LAVEVALEVGHLVQATAVLAAAAVAKQPKQILLE
jgi:hypothetical protein